jgi:SAM-dependent methyltransferase
MWGNGIHYLDEESQQKAILNLRRILKPGGWFLFNSAFCAESRPEETLPFYKAQIANAVRQLRSLGADRDKSMPKPDAASFLDKTYYQNMLQQAGFRVQEMKDLAARLYKTAWEHISGFSQYAAGALHGYRADIAAKALREAVGPSLEEHGQRDEQNRLYIQRNWVATIAQLGEPRKA